MISLRTLIFLFAFAAVLFATTTTKTATAQDLTKNEVMASNAINITDEDLTNSADDASNAIATNGQDLTNSADDGMDAINIAAQDRTKNDVMASDSNIVSTTDLIINEVMASNATTIADQDGDYNDWIELLNRGDQTIFLNGYGLSDNYNNPFKWVFPDITIEPGAYLLVWASGKDRGPIDGELHTNYRISASGEEIILTTPYGIRIDELEPTPIPTDVSLGRPGPSASTYTTNASEIYYDSGNNSTNAPYSTSTNTITNSTPDTTTTPLEWRFFNNPTPGAQNGSDGYLNILTPPLFSVQPGFYGGEVYLQVYHPDPTVKLWINSWSDSTAFANGGGQTLASDTRFTSTGGASAVLHLQPDTSTDTTLRLSFIRTNPVEIDNESYQWLPPSELKPRAHNVQVIATKAGHLPSTIATGTWFIDIPIASPPPTPLENQSQGSQSQNPSQGQSQHQNIDPYGRPPAGHPTQTKQRNVPVISITANKDHFFGDSLGIYVPGDVYQKNMSYGQGFSEGWANYHQRGDEWERLVNIELFYGPERVFSQEVGVRIHGGTSRTLPMKSLRLYARNMYGQSTMAHDFFGDDRYTDYKRILLRNGGQDFNARGTMLRDAFMQTMVSGLRMETMSYRPSIVYINGEYWGIHNIRERYDHHYMLRKYGIAEHQFDMLNAGPMIEYGNGDAYNEIVQYVQNNNMNDPAAYDFISARIDLGNVIDYQASQMFFGNDDWPANNLFFWRYSGTPTDQFGPRDGRFRWMLYDTDFGFDRAWSHDVTHNMLEFATDSTSTSWPNAAQSTIIIRNLFKNERFRQEFVLRSADLLNSVFTPAHTIGLFDAMADVIDPFMADHINRWNHVSSLSLWKHNLDHIRYFATDRPEYVWGHYVDYFDLSNPYAIEIDMQSTGTPSEVDEDTLSAPGYIRLNTLELGPFEGAQKGYQRGVFESAFEKPDISSERLRIRTGFPWEGTYFGGVNVNLEATARDGYLFDVWEIYGSHFEVEDSLYTEFATVLIEDPEITIISYEALHITAHYVASTGLEPIEPQLPLVLQLGSNYPNPFNPTTVIPFTLPENGQVRLDVFDVTGRHVGTFLNRELSAGKHEVTVNLSGVSSGVYIYRLQAQDRVVSGKMVLLK